jgi:hypothetical protein
MLSSLITAAIGSKKILRVATSSIACAFEFWKNIISCGFLSNYTVFGLGSSNHKEFINQFILAEV